MAQFIKLNVGGYEYSATKSTLCADSQSMLAMMFDGKFPNTKDEEGRVIIDRDGEMFQYILNFLRSSKLALPKDFKKIDQLALEADFFQMDALGREIDRIKSKPVVRLYYQEDVTTENKSYGQYHEYGITAYITGISEEIDNLSLQKQGWTPDSASELQMKGIYKTEKLRIGNAHVARDKGYDYLYQKTNRICIQDYMLSKGWKIEKSEKENHPRSYNFPLLSVTYIKSTD